jgi:nucleoside-diphosphate-sugar epimerase
VIFASSLAAFGAPLPDPIGDDYLVAPLTSYGTQKAIGELLISDYTRKGFVDGLALRLPTICVRPGKPNAAASGFFSAIIREPLAGQEAVLPVSEDVMHWHASPRAAIGFLLHAASLDGERVGPRRAFTLPGCAVTVGEQIAALRRIAGDKVAARIVRKPDPFVQRIIAGWPRRFDTKRARDLGFEAEHSFEDIIRVHIEDELGGMLPA